MPKTLTLILDDVLAARLDRAGAELGCDGAVVMEQALRGHLDHLDDVRARRDQVVAAACEGEATAAPGLAAAHDAIRLWLLSWGDEDERKRPRSC